MTTKIYNVKMTLSPRLHNLFVGKFSFQDLYGTKVGSQVSLVRFPDCQSRSGNLTNYNAAVFNAGANGGVVSCNDGDGDGDAGQNGFGFGP